MATKIFCSFVGTLALVSCVTGSVLRAETCPNRSVVSPFALERYLGTWYEIEKIPTLFESGGKCIQAVYTDNKNGTVEVHNSRIMADTGEYTELFGIARLTGESDEAKLGVLFPSLPFASESPYWVLATDYNTYAIVWSCTEAAVGQKEFLWYLSRERNPNEATKAGVRAMMKGLGLDTSKVVVTDQSNCPNSH